jgi:hypothetical protein
MKTAKIEFLYSTLLPGQAVYRYRNNLFQSKHRILLTNVTLSQKRLFHILRFLGFCKLWFESPWHPLKCKPSFHDDGTSYNFSLYNEKKVHSIWKKLFHILRLLGQCMLWCGSAWRPLKCKPSLHDGTWSLLQLKKKNEQRPALCKQCCNINYRRLSLSLLKTTAYENIKCIK